MSVLDELRRVYAQADPETDHIDLDVPAGRGGLVVRYQAPTDRALINDTMNSILAGRAVRDDADVDLIVHCTREILLREHDGTLKPLAAEGERPVRFDKDDKRLGDAFGFTYPTAREAVKQLFRVDRFPASTLGHAERLVPFLQGLDELGRQRVEGEAEAATAATSTTPSPSTSPA